MKYQPQRVLILVFIGIQIFCSNSQSDQCKIIYNGVSIAPTFSYVYSDSTVKVFLDTNMIYLGVDKYKVYRDINLAVNAATSHKPLKECRPGLDGEIIDISINNTTYHNFNFAHECNSIDSTSRHLIFRANSAFNLSKSDIYTKIKPVFDSLIKNYMMQITKNKNIPTDF